MSAEVEEMTRDRTTSLLVHGLPVQEAEGLETLVTPQTSRILDILPGKADVGPDPDPAGDRPADGAGQHHQATAHKVASQL